MPEKEKIGEDILSYNPPSGRMSKKRAEDIRRAKEAVKKKKAKEAEEEEPLPKLGVPGEKPPEMSEEEWQELLMRARITGQLLEEEKKKTVHVDEHYRRPKKKKKEIDWSLW